MLVSARTTARLLRMSVAVSLTLGAAAAAQAPAPVSSTPADQVAPSSPAPHPPPGSNAPRLGADQPLPAAELEAFVDGMVHQAMAADHLVGVTLSVVQDGRPVLDKGYGFADLGTGRRVDPHATLFRIGSITKTFTWIAMMKAVEAGRIGLDDPVNTRLPSDLQIPSQGMAEPIRVRHLLTHSAGFEDRVFGHLFEGAPEGIRPSNVYLREERPDRVREPGQISSYSNYGVLLAGAILEKIEGRRWQDVVEAEILVPLGLTHTSVREPYPPRDDLPAPMPETLAGNLSRGYRWTGAAHQVRDLEYITHFAPAGVMSSTAADMARYMTMLLNDGSLDGAQIFGPQAAKAFRTRMTSFPPGVGNWDAGFWETRLPGGFSNFGHDGGTLSFFSSMVMVPELRLGIFVSTNTEGGDKLSGVLPARIIERFYAPPAGPPPAGRPDLAKSRSIYEGQYLPTRRRHSGLEGFLSRLQAAAVTVSDDGYLEAFDQRFLPTDRPDEFHSIDRTAGPFGGLRFVREGEKATRIESFAIAFERVGLLFQPRTLLALAALTLGVSLATLLGLRIRLRRSFPQTLAQRLAAWLQGLSATAWIASAGAAAALAAALADDAPTVVFFAWPHAAILVSTTAALLATLLAGGGVLLLPAVWRGRQATPGWTLGRKLRFTAATAVFAIFGVLLALWGALQPWNP